MKRKFDYRQRKGSTSWQKQTKHAREVTPCNYATLQQDSPETKRHWRDAKHDSRWVLRFTPKVFAPAPVCANTPLASNVALCEVGRVDVLSYGIVFTFTLRRGSQRARDSRSGSLVPLAWVRSELRRLLGATEGDVKFASLVS